MIWLANIHNSSFAHGIVPGLEQESESDYEESDPLWSPIGEEDKTVLSLEEVNDETLEEAEEEVNQNFMFKTVSRWHNHKPYEGSNYAGNYDVNENFCANSRGFRFSSPEQWN